jgi:dolichol-phosphate mannosyltransferase
MNSIGICIPTFNESRNLQEIIDQIQKYLPNAQVYIVDDNSPDGTGILAKQMAVSNNRLHVVQRQCKSGLGAAYREGFHILLQDKSIDLVAQMDADLSHPVCYITTMIEKTKKADLVIGSRYVPGGKIKNWSYARRLVSRCGSLYAKLWLGLSINDLTGGYKIWRRALLEDVLAHPLSSSGYVFQVEMTYRASRLGANIIEVPITFIERARGKSKMSAKIALEACLLVPKLRLGSDDHNH